MRYILLFIILSSSCMAYEAFTYDPNTVVVTEKTVTFDVKLTMSREHYDAMQYLQLNIVDIFKRSTFGRLCLKLIPTARNRLVRDIKFNDLKAKVERE